MPRILIVEDEPDIALGLEDDLTVEGYHVEIAGDGVTALRRAREPGWDLILLDVMLPGKDGFDVCRELRRGGIRTPDHPVDRAAQEAEKVLGLELGADDYVTKPFSPRELRARIKAGFATRQTDVATVIASVTWKWTSHERNCAAAEGPSRSRRSNCGCSRRSSGVVGAC